MERRPGYYAGTEINGYWWKRYTGEGFFARGNGEFWYDEEAFSFLRNLTTSPLTIPFRNVEGFQLGGWHAGRWVWRKRAIKFIWRRDGLQLSSGFVLTRSESDARRMIAVLSDLRETGKS